MSETMLRWIMMTPDKAVVAEIVASMANAPERKVIYAMSTSLGAVLTFADGSIAIVPPQVVESIHAKIQEAIALSRKAT